MHCQYVFVVVFIFSFAENTYHESLSVKTKYTHKYIMYIILYNWDQWQYRSPCIIYATVYNDAKRVKICCAIRWCTFSCTLTITMTIYIYIMHVCDVNININFILCTCYLGLIHFFFSCFLKIFSPSLNLSKTSFKYGPTFHLIWDCLSSEVTTDTSVLDGCEEFSSSL